MVASITRIRSPLNFLLNQSLIVTVVPKYLSCDTFSNDLFAIFISRFWATFWWRDSSIYLVFSTFISRPISLLVSIKDSVFFSGVPKGAKGQVSEQWYKDGSNIILIKVTSATVDY
jgi:hypothetical protein